MATSRTLGPLHFEDLEPKRFEDLVRQLAYDFKSWRRLEATGRAGSDDGFDARGYEIGRASELSVDDEEIAEDKAAIDRLWLIQCKREKSISPKKLAAYLDQIKINDSEPLRGLIFVAACDFSKKSRDEFRIKCESLGVEEWHLWGKAELEDQLFQKKNDHLLFAYFGVSLTFRRRSRKAEISQLLATKRKAHRTLEGKSHSQILLRDANDDSYPVEPENHRLQPRWIAAQYREAHANGLVFVVSRYFAYLSDDAQAWDAALSLNDTPNNDDRWSERGKILQFWNSLPEQNRAWFEVMMLVSYEDIVAIDELGDNYHHDPHMYVEFDAKRGPFSAYVANVSAGGQWNRLELSPESLSDRRVEVFPADMRAADDVTSYSPAKLFGA